MHNLQEAQGGCPTPISQVGVRRHNLKEGKEGGCLSTEPPAPPGPSAQLGHQLPRSEGKTENTAGVGGNVNEMVARVLAWYRADRDSGAESLLFYQSKHGQADTYENIP